MTARYYAKSKQPSEITIKAQDLISRYPDLGEEEIAQLVKIFPKIPILDKGLMTADHRLSEKLAAFERDHAAKLGLCVKSMLWFLAFPVALVIGGLWWLLG